MMNVTEQAQQGLFISPSSHKPLSLIGIELVTSDGLERYSIVGDRVFFIDVPLEAKETEMAEEYDSFNCRLSRLKRYARDKLFHVRKSRHSAQARQQFAAVASDSFTLSIGGGPLRFFNACNLNIGPFDNVEVIADAHALPYADNSIGCIHCVAVLEHLSAPDHAVKEMFRVLKPGGLIYIETPFLQPYHGYPHHYQGFTLTGHNLLAVKNGFKEISSGASIGPGSALMILICEYIRNYFFFGWFISALFRISLGVLMVNYDKFISDRKSAHIIAGSVYFLGKK